MKPIIKIIVAAIIAFDIFITTDVFAIEYAIQNGTIITVSGDTIANGTLVIHNGRIAEIGGDVATPKTAMIVDASGLFVYPGMIDAATSLGLSEVGAVAATQDVYEMGTFNPHIKAEIAINPHSEHIPVARCNGITAAMVVPGGAIISGQCALINLAGWTIDEMLLQAPVGFIVNFPRMPQDEPRRQPSLRRDLEKLKRKTLEQIRELEQFVGNAKRYHRLWEKYNQSPQPPAPNVDLALEALAPVVRNEAPLIVNVDQEEDIKNAIEFVKKMELRAIFLGVREGWKVAPQLAENQIPTLVGPVLRSPGSKDPYDAIYANAATLHRAGVKIAIITQSASDVRSLPYHAGTAAAFGLPKAEALKAVTIYPAEILGVADRVGSLDVGKIANVIVTDGDPLEMTTQIKHLFIAGEKIKLESKHTRLYEQFKERN